MIKLEKEYITEKGLIYKIHRHTIIHYHRHNHLGQ